MSDEKQTQNGVTMPRIGTKTRKVWEIATQISEKENRPCTRVEILSACDEEGIPNGTASTQYSHWRKYHGLSGGRIVKPKETKVIPIPKKKEEAPVEQTENQVPNDGNTDVYDAGWDAYCDGKNETDCPYEADTSNASEWTQGYREASES